MNLDQIAGELRQMPDAALQQQAKAPGAVPGYLVADEIQRRIQARKAPPQQGNDQGKPTILSILANNLAPPQTPISKPMAQVPFSPVPSNNLMTQPTMPQHLDDGGTVKSFDPSTLYSDVPVGPGSGSAGDVQTNDLATAAPPSAMPPTPVWNPPTSAATPDEAQPPVSSYPQTSTSPIQDPPNTHKGGRSFLETLTALAPAMQYLGNIGAGAGRAGGNFATGVGYANEQQQAQMQLDQARKDKQAELAQEMALKQGQMGMESQKIQMEGLMGGAKFVGPDGKVQEAPVNAPSANINGVPMGGGQIAGSGSVPSNPQMTQMTGLPGYGGRQMDYSDILTEQKKMQLAQQNEYAKQANQAALNVATKQAEMVPVPAELATHGFTPSQMVYPATLDKLLEASNPKEPDKPLGEDRVNQMNQQSQLLWNKMGNQGPMDPSLVLPKTATIGDSTRLDAMLNKVVQGAATAQQRDLGNQMRQEGLNIAASNQSFQQGMRQDAELDKLNSSYGKQYETAVTQGNAQLEKIQDAKAFLNGGIEAQKLAAPKILTALVSAPGSGVRITMPELNQILKSYGISEDVGMFLNHVQGKGIYTADEQKAYSGILDSVANRIQQKNAIANEALTNFRSSGSRDQFMQAEQNARTKLNSFEQHPQTAGTNQFKVGDTVNYNGTPHKVTGITPDGKLQLSQ
jgi:hypothetical protein